MPDWLWEFTGLVWRHCNKRVDCQFHPKSRFVRDLHLRQDERQSQRTPQVMEAHRQQSFSSILERHPTLKDCIKDDILRIGITEGTSPFKSPSTRGTLSGLDNSSPYNRGPSFSNSEFQASPRHSVPKKSRRRPKSLEYPTSRIQFPGASTAVIKTVGGLPSNPLLEEQQDTFIQVVRSDLLPGTSKQARSRVYLTPYSPLCEHYRFAVELCASLMVGPDPIANALILASPPLLQWRPDAIVFCLKDAELQTLKSAAKSIAYVKQAYAFFPNPDSSTSLPPIEPVRCAPYVPLPLPNSGLRTTTGNEIVFAAANWQPGESYCGLLQALFDDALAKNKYDEIQFYRTVWQRFEEDFPEMLSLYDSIRKNDNELSRKRLRT
ncbi:MAG: hypothetical protein AAF355_12820 [Myxococcota bacterium]